MGKYLDKIEYAKNRSEFMKIIEDHNDSFDNMDWLYVCKSKFFVIDLADTYADKLRWEYLCTFTKLEEKDIEKYGDYVIWHEISCFQKLSIPFIKKHKDKLSLNRVITNSKISINDNPECWRIFNENNDPKHHKIWDENLQKATLFCPKLFISKYMDYPGARDDSLIYKVDRYGQLIELTPEEKQERLKAKKEREDKLKAEQKAKKNQSKSKTTKSEMNADDPKKVQNKPKNSKKKTKLDYSVMTKSQLKEVLASRNVKVLYHDTLEILRRKCSDSEKHS